MDKKEKITGKQIFGVIVGNIILGVGVAILRFSQMGNDPFCAANMALSEAVGMGLGTFQLIVNIVLFLAQLKWGRHYIGLGTIINLFLLGYIVQFTTWVLGIFVADGVAFGVVTRFVIMVIAMIVLTFGLSMYQVADLGVAPYDYLALGMTEHLPTKYFLNRMITDGICTFVIVASVLLHITDWANSHLGLGTVIAAFCLGPLVEFFARFHRKWMNVSVEED